MKKNKYDVRLSFKQAQEEMMLIQTFESQVIRSINNIRGNRISEKEYFELKKRKKRIVNRKHSNNNYKELMEVQKQLDDAMFMEDYIIIEMIHNSHYDYLFKNGLKLNGKVYKRFSCSAGQARTKMVMFARVDILEELNRRMDNGRDMNKELVASKYNAYKGLASSATRVVRPPRFCVVPDIEVEKKLDCWYVTETDANENDILEKRTVDIMSNLFDGQGLITPDFAWEWAEDLEVDYLPAQFCIRQNFIKGMLCTFDIVKFCKEKNNGNYIINDIYGDKVDLREIDVILTESQFKLWDSFPNLDTYIKNCKKNKLDWGVSLFTPKEDKDILFMNYQFLQTLNLDDEDIEELCSQFIDWISGVTVDNPDYTLLYSLGTNMSEGRVNNFLSHRNKEDYWLKSLLINRHVLNDEFFRRKIRDTLAVKINQACLGRIIVDGNFQVMVSDPYGLMEHVCGLEVKGLLGEKEYYSGYWNRKGINRVSASRSPLNYKSEHLVYDLKKTDDTEEWYKYCYTGVMLNIHGNETVHHGGSDFDYDIIATSSNEVIIKGIDMTELPIYYEPPKSTKKVLTEEDLFFADKFGFGSIIGSITNKGSSAYALMGNYEKDSDEYKELLTRVRMCTKLQSSQIDKTKIGREVKGIPKFWVNPVKYEDFESYDEEYVLKIDKQNELLLDKHPYFFIYLYEDTKKEYTKVKYRYDFTSKLEYGLDIDELLSLETESRTEVQKEFVNEFLSKSPVIYSDGIMNKICKQIEKEMKSLRWRYTDCDKDVWYLYLDNAYEFDKSKYNKLKTILNRELSRRNDKIQEVVLTNLSYRKVVYGLDREERCNEFLDEEKILRACLKISTDIYELTNYVVRYFYEYKKSFSKKILWDAFGEYMYQNVIKNTNEPIYTLVKNEYGDIEYLGEKFSRKEIDVESI